MEHQGKKGSGHVSPIAAGGSDAIGSGRLIVVSNRAPIRVVHEAGKQKIEPTVGGVGSTFLRLLEHMGGLWIAWSGTQTKTSSRLMMPPGADPPRFQIVFCPLGERDISPASGDGMDYRVSPGCRSAYIKAPFAGPAVAFFRSRRIA